MNQLSEDNRDKINRLIETFDETNWLLALELCKGLLGENDAKRYIETIVDLSLPTHLKGEELIFYNSFIEVHNTKTWFIDKHCKKNMTEQELIKITQLVNTKDLDNTQLALQLAIGLNGREAANELIIRLVKRIVYPQYKTPPGVGIREQLAKSNKVTYKPLTRQDLDEWFHDINGTRTYKHIIFKFLKNNCNYILSRKDKNVY